MPLESSGSSHPWESQDIAKREEAIFGHAVVSGSLLENLYSYLTINEIEALDTSIVSQGDTGLWSGIENLLDTDEKWKNEQVKQGLRALQAFKAEFTAISPDDAGARRKAIEKYKALVGMLSEAIDGLNDI